jgi:O-antigen/teichoic acid export membrane protein
MSYEKFSKHVVILGLTQAVTALSGIITLPIITKLLGAQNYGIWTQLLVTIGFISTTAILDFPYALVRFLPGEKNPKEIRDGIWSVLTIMAGILISICALLIIFSKDIGHFLGCPQLFIMLLAFIIIFECLNDVFYNIFRVFQEVKKYCLFVILQKIAETGSVIAAIVLGRGLLGAVIALLTIKIIVFFISGSLVVKKVGITVPKFLRTREYLSFCLPLMPGDVSFWIIQSSDKYLIGFFLGTLFVGYYAPAYTLGCVLTFFVMPLSFLLPATLSQHHDQDQTHEVKTYLTYSLKYFLMIAIPAVFGLSVLSKQLLTTFSTPEIATHSYLVVPFVALSILLFGVYSIVAQIIFLKKKTKLNGSIWLVAALLNFGLNIIVIPRFGILGASITTLIAYAFVAGAGCYYSFRQLRFHIDWNIIAKSIVASLAMALAIVWINPVGLYRNLGTIALGMAVYAAAILVLKVFTPEELSLFKRKLQDAVKPFGNYFS